MKRHHGEPREPVVNIAARLKQLERSRAVAPCDGRPTGVVVNNAPIPEARRCPRCGECHILRVKRVIVNAPRAEDNPP